MSRSGRKENCEKEGAAHSTLIAKGRKKERPLTWGKREDPEEEKESRRSRGNEKGAL